MGFTDTPVAHWFYQTSHIDATGPLFPNYFYGLPAEVANAQTFRQGVMPPYYPWPIEQLTAQYVEGRDALEIRCEHRVFGRHSLEWWPIT